jgi:hypothetical protein
MKNQQVHQLKLNLAWIFLHPQITQTTLWQAWSKPPVYVSSFSSCLIIYELRACSKEISQRSSKITFNPPAVITQGAKTGITKFIRYRSKIPQVDRSNGDFSDREATRTVALTRGDTPVEPSSVGQGKGSGNRGNLSAL